MGAIQGKSQALTEGAPHENLPTASALGPTNSWSEPLRLFHWSSAVAVATQLLIGFLLLGGAAMATSSWLAVHLTLGLAILGLTLVRLVFRLRGPVPQRAEPRALAIVAGIGHFGLYALLILVALTGWLGHRPTPFQTPPHLFGVLPMPVIAGLSPIATRTMLTIHSLASWTLLALIGVHVAAALFHFIVLGDEVLQSMLFRAKRPA